MLVLAIEPISDFVINIPNCNAIFDKVGVKKKLPNEYSKPTFEQNGSIRMRNLNDVFK